MFTVIANKETDNINKQYSQYYQALTTAITLQNNGYKVEIKRS